MKMLRLAIIAIVLTASSLGCHTMKGLGKDIERGGEKLQEAAGR